MDQEYNILYETHDIWKGGNFSKVVKKAMKKYGVEDPKYYCTDYTLFEIKHHNYVLSELARHTEERKQNKDKENLKYFKI